MLILFETVYIFKLYCISGIQFLGFAVCLGKESNTCILSLTFSKLREKYFPWQYVCILTFTYTYTYSASSLSDITFLFRRLNWWGSTTKFIIENWTFKTTMISNFFVTKLGVSDTEVRESFSLCPQALQVSHINVCLLLSHSLHSHPSLQLLCSTITII